MKEMLPEVKLLPYRYKRYGVWVLIIGIPVMALLSMALLSVGLITDRQSFFAEWSYLMVYYPIIIGLALLNFSKEKDEDEMVQHLRYQAFMNGVYYLIVGILMLPFFYNVFRLLRGASIGMPDIGGMLGALALLLFYTYLSFRYKLHQTRKSLAADAE
ncbi:hypothetical protein Q4E40_19650 [Pontibacter sp. BT731]|uniref:hypothetical protein n=1 Tax=Pontibacter coccineus TaxID=3063328 RepID=UPI0026E31B61|nr:hypothetical protein [Pontibacter sp. BT731]MDO6392359.1 hypothetical protein [Pontibacter sp. BT731]